jgi:conjugative transposon TraN protein
MAFDIDFVRLKIVDKKTTKRTAIQETVIYPIRTYHHDIQIPGKKTERTVFSLKKFTIPDGKQLVVELFEKNGGRHQQFIVENSDIVRAKVIDDLKVK